MTLLIALVWFACGWVAHDCLTLWRLKIVAEHEDVEAIRERVRSLAEARAQKAS